MLNEDLIVGIIMQRNESLILKDTLDSLGQIVDKIIVFDDASGDNSCEIAENHSKVVKVIKRDRWNPNRYSQETKDRQKLLEEAKKLKPKWIFYSDCDERFEGNIRDYLLSVKSKNVDAIRISLFDAYITDADKEDYSGGDLYNFRKKFGPEKRDILMIWRNKPDVHFQGADKREPKVEGRIITKFYCQHYGKSISIDQWENTCDYYSKYFPEPYASKWLNRKGKAIHQVSDFERELYTWEDVKKRSKKIYPETRIKKFLRKIEKSIAYLKNKIYV